MDKELKETSKLIKKKWEYQWRDRTYIIKHMLTFYIIYLFIYLLCLLIIICFPLLKKTLHEDKDFCFLVTRAWEIVDSQHLLIDRQLMIFFHIQQPITYSSMIQRNI